MEYRMTHPRNPDTVVSVEEDRAYELSTRGWTGFSGKLEDKDPDREPVEHPYPEGTKHASAESQSPNSRGPNDVSTERRVRDRKRVI